MARSTALIRDFSSPDMASLAFLSSVICSSSHSCVLAGSTWIFANTVWGITTASQSPVAAAATQKARSSALIPVGTERTFAVGYQSTNSRLT